MKKIFCIFLICISFFSIKCYGQMLDTTLNVYESEFIKPSFSGMLGINDTWVSGILYTGDSVSTELSDKYKNTIYSLGIPINQIRMAGADAHQFNWKDSLGDLHTRANGQNLGLVEWIKFNKELNPEVQFTFTLNIIEDDVKDHQDLIRFLTLNPEDENATDENGFNWAQYRVDLGITEPVEIAVFELGNEVYYDYVEGCSEKQTVSDASVIEGVNKYINDCKNIISEMKSIKDDLCFSAVSFSYSEATPQNAKEWNSRLVNELYTLCDYFTHHEYFFDYNFYWSNLRLKERLLDYIAALPTGNKPQVYISEYGYWMDKSLDNKKDGTCLSGTLTLAKYLNFIINNPYVERANIHVTNEGISSDESWHSGWDLFRFYDDGQIYATVPTEMLKLFNSAMGKGSSNENVVKTCLSGDHNYWANYIEYPGIDGTDVGLLTASAHTTSDGGLNLLLVNPSESVEHNLSLFFENEYKLFEKEILTSESLSDNNLPGAEDVVYTKRFIENNDASFNSVIIPAKSIVLLKLIPLESEGISNKIKFTGEYKLTDGKNIVGKYFGIQRMLYENDKFSYNEGADVYVINSDISPEDFVVNPIEYVNDVAYFSEATIKRNILYCNIVMPEKTENDEYYILVGNPIDGLYFTEKVTYENQEKNISDLKIESITKRNNSNGYFIRLNCKADFTDENIIVKAYREKNDGMIEYAYLGSVIADSVIEEDIIFSDESFSGEYVIELMWNDGNAVKSVKTSFDFEKVDELISIYSNLQNEKSETLTFENITQSDKMVIELTNKTSDLLPAAVFVAAYDNSKRLLSVYCNSADIDAGSNKNVEISLDGINQLDNIDVVKVFVWKINNNQPLTNVVYVK